MRIPIEVVTMAGAAAGFGLAALLLSRRPRAGVRGCFGALMLTISAASLMVSIDHSSYMGS